MTARYIRINGMLHTPDTVAESIAAPDFRNRPGWQQNIFLFLERWWGKEQYIEQYTSGSTGSPKTILLSKKNMLASARRTCRFFHLHEQSKVLLCLNTEYIAGKMMLVRAICSGFNILTVPPGDNPLKEVDEGRLNFAAMVPLQAENILTSLATQQVGETKIDTILLGGTQITEALLTRIIQQTATIFYIGYGMTETCSHVALRKLDKKDDGFYLAMDGVHISLDSDGCAVIDDKSLSGSPIKTNDLVEINSQDKTRFRWLGRADLVINSGGIKFCPEELEKKVAHLFEKPFIFSSVPDERLGQKIVLLIEAHVTTPVRASSEQKTALLDIMRPFIPRYGLPREVILLPVLARTSNGKVNRAECQKNARNKWETITNEEKLSI